ncbi:MAG: DUF4010 domain-containing protein [Deltaproteobacteria bacterium]|nr:DUF4010 domain-containing protein [Deltaproteobacteria bacterium]
MKSGKKGKLLGLIPASYGRWVKAFFVIFWLAVITVLLPSEPIDPWGLFSPRKVTLLVLVLITIQTLGGILSQALGSRAGSFLSGFVGGVFSSTAVTAQIARNSHNLTDDENRVATLSFLGSILAQMVLALALAIIGSTGHLLDVALLIGLPIIGAALLTVFRSRKVRVLGTIPNHRDPLSDLLGIAKLSLFIIAIIAVSKFLQQEFGQNGLSTLTFLVSLFEVHGSIIANLQLEEHRAIDHAMLRSLISIGLIASLVSKLALGLFLGNRFFKRRIAIWSLFLAMWVLAGWVAASALTTNI